jgi:hypothetical protein
MYLWKPWSALLNTELQVRVGGSFVWPPSGIDLTSVKRVVFVAGGVGINPLMSMLSHIAEMEDVPFSVHFLYSFKTASPGGEVDGEIGTEIGVEKKAKILFEDRLRSIFGKGNVGGELAIYRTSGAGGDAAETERIKEGKGDRVSEKGKGKVVVRERRIGDEDVLKALGHVEEREGTVCYVCGVPSMTDHFVDVASKAEGMSVSRVLFERWW